MIRISKEIYDSLSDEELFILKLIEEIKSLKKEIIGLVKPQIDSPFSDIDLSEYAKLQESFSFLKDPSYKALQRKIGADPFEDDPQYRKDIEQLKANGYSKSGYPRLLK